MPRAEDEAYAVAAAAPRAADGSVDIELYMAEYERRLAERQQRLMRDARSAFRVMDGWSGVKSQEDWENAVQQASEDYDRGAFLIDRLGAERHLDPALMAVLLVLRRRLIDEYASARKSLGSGRPSSPASASCASGRSGSEMRADLDRSAKAKRADAPDLVAICDHCGKRIVDVLDWVVIESVELCAACYAATTTRRQGRA